MATTTAITNPLITMSVQAFMQENKFTTVNKEIGFNTNQYPFVTFISADNKAENIYFSKKLSDNYKPGDTINKGFFAALQIIKTVNAAGEERIKLGSLGGDNRLSVDDLF